MIRLRFSVAAAAVLVAVCASTPASAQLFGGRRQDEAIATLQRDVAAITQRLDGSPGQPGLAPALQTARGELDRARARINDLEQALRTLNGTVEGLTGELAQSRQQRDAVVEQNRELQERIARMESSMAALQRSVEQAARTPAAPPEETAPEEDSDEAPPARRPASADESWADARLLLRNQDYERAGAAFQAFASAYPRDPRAQEASHHLAETRYMREDWQGAAAAYAASLRGWPRATWAAESALKLAQTLGRLERDAEGCQAIAEFRRRYAPTASERGRQRADAIARELACAA